MINYNYECDFRLEDEQFFSDWITRVIESENKSTGEIAYIFCDDDYLLEINQQYLDHDTLTDIISFDYTENDIISGDIFISIDRVQDNADDFDTPFEEELKRVMIHGILHYCGYKDKSSDEEALMRNKEEEKINMFHVKH
ncbi:rRNA maturation RNase YbeY [Flavobacterium luminosum]|uniref:Endoribonuclease YbeY n=1 Tax=Flavobacterium luminosum TaxID=2949086 RepID=A0ABT0TR48_9FLAO|nr:rRNA maturation RNase YbeY [Flavobacterium sp. HXWNR70]MCL9809960.1 rRNA maturation RNase YbeY [Flavobacterium sp. HXWNR70]